MNKDPRDGEHSGAAQHKSSPFQYLSHYRQSSDEQLNHLARWAGTANSSQLHRIGCADRAAAIGVRVRRKFYRDRLRRDFAARAVGFNRDAIGNTGVHLPRRLRGRRCVTSVTCAPRHDIVGCHWGIDSDTQVKAKRISEALGANIETLEPFVESRIAEMAASCGRGWSRDSSPCRGRGRKQLKRDLTRLVLGRYIEVISYVTLSSHS